MPPDPLACTHTNTYVLCVRTRPHTSSHSHQKILYETLICMDSYLHTRYFGTHSDIREFLVLKRSKYFLKCCHMTPPEAHSQTQSQ